MKTGAAGGRALRAMSAAVLLALLDVGTAVAGPASGPLGGAPALFLRVALAISVVLGVLLLPALMLSLALRTFFNRGAGERARQSGEGQVAVRRTISPRLG
jgi:hypothetical protein